MCRPKAAGKATAAQSASRCPFSIRSVGHNSYLIRENDSFGEHPHIYAKLVTSEGESGKSASVILLGDTGVGTSAQNADNVTGPPTWTIWSFLESTINAGSKIPYLVILSHCHYDHILGLKHLSSLESGTFKETPDESIVSSSHQKSFVTPYSHLNVHSLCNAEGIPAPHYEVDVWANDYQSLMYKHPGGGQIDLDVTILHTPGHTPDSLSWYDKTLRTLFVGDSFYQQVSPDTEGALWDREESAPVIFPKEGNLFDWWESTKKLTSFVEHENSKDTTGRETASHNRVQLAAGHVTASVDAYKCLTRIRTYMARVLRDEIPWIELPDRRGQPTGHWTEDSKKLPGEIASEFSIVAPVALIEKGRKTIPRDEWA